MKKSLIQIDKRGFTLLNIDIKGIAKELNITPSYVSMILSGKRKSFKYKTRIQNLIKQAAKELKAA